VSALFYGWLSGLGGDVLLAGPDNVIDEYRNYLKSIIAKY
jgi:hypothetical protein